MKSHAREYRDGRRGAALVFVMGVFAVVTISLASFLSLLHASINYARREEAHARAVHAAEAGLEKAVAELRAGRTDYAGDTGIAVGDGKFSVGIEGENGAYTITSTGEGVRAGANAAVVLQADVKMEGRHVVAYAWREVPF